MPIGNDLRGNCQVQSGTVPERGSGHLRLSGLAWPSGQRVLGSQGRSQRRQLRPDFVRILPQVIVDFKPLHTFTSMEQFHQF